MTLAHRHAGAPPALIVGTASMVLDSTTFAQVQTALGASSIVVGDDGTGPYRQRQACYVAGAGNERVTVRLRALGAVDDRHATMQQVLAAIPLQSAAIARGDLIGPLSSPTPKRCAPLSVPPAEIHWAGGLRLGMTRAEVERLLGAPTDNMDGELIYEHDSTFREVSVDTATRKEVRRNAHVGGGTQVRYDRNVATRIEASYWKKYANP